MHTTLPPLRVLPVAHLPLVRGVIDQLGLEEVIDAHLPKHVLVSDAECVKAMRLSILSGRQALWKQDLWLGKIDAELLLGEGVEAAAFHDTRLGVALDRLDEVGTDHALSLQYRDQESLIRSFYYSKEVAGDDDDGDDALAE